MPANPSRKLSEAGEQVLAGKNVTSHTRVYINDILHIDTSAGIMDTPVVGYQINRSRKLGAAKLVLKVSNPKGMYSYKKQTDPIFGYGNTIAIQEGIATGSSVEWFPRFNGIIVSQIASNLGGKPALKVHAMDKMKLLLDYLPDEIYYKPDVIKVKGEVLTEVPGGSMMHFRGDQDNLPWVDIPYPIFYKDGEKIKENYEVDLINGEVYFGEKMWGGARNFEATQLTSTKYAVYKAGTSIPVEIQPGYRVYRHFRMVRSNGFIREQIFDTNIPANIGVTCNGNEIMFSQDPFSDVGDSSNMYQYIDKKIYVTIGAAYQVTADYWYYDDHTNLAENVIRDLALRAGFKSEDIDLQETGVSLKPLHFTNLKVRNGFEALQKIKQQLSPNYIITCDSEGKLRGYYASQNSIADYNLGLIKRVDVPISEQGLYSGVVAHGIDLNPTDLTKIATAKNLLPADCNRGIAGIGSLLGDPNQVITVSGSPLDVLNKSADDQISWHWIQMNNNTPPEFPIDLLTITLAETKKIEEINVLVGDYNGGTIQQSLSIMVSEEDDGENWFYIDRSSRGLTGASSQWLTIKGGELENRKIKRIKFSVEAACSWVETHTYSESSGFLGLGTDVKSDNYYHWYFALKEVQIWEENTIEVTTTLCNCLGLGDGVKDTFYFPNVPIAQEPIPVTIYVDGRQLASTAYSLEPLTGKITFIIPPRGVITANYSVETKIQPRTQTTNAERFSNNVTITNPSVNVGFTGGAIQLDSPQHRLLKKIGIKKIALKVDNYLNSFSDTKKRGEEMLREISRISETLDIDAVYRPDVDICQTVSIYDPILGIMEQDYFIEEITETKEGYKPALNLKVSNYSLTEN